MGRRTTITIKTGRSYSLGNFIVDCIMVPLTGGLWLIWMIVR
jgi:hypothetical protein